MNGGLLLESVSVIAFGFLNLVPGYHVFIALAFVLRIAQGLGSAAYVTASNTIVMCEFPDKLGTAMSSLKTAYTLGTTVGCTIGGFLFERGGYSLPFLTCGCMEILCVVASIIVVPDVVHKASATRNIFKQFWTNPMVYLFGAVIFSCNMCAGFNQSTLEPHLRQFGLSPSVVGLLFTTQGVLWLVTIPIWGFLCDRNVNTTFLTLLGCLLMCIYLALIGPAPFLPFPPELWLVITSLLFFGAGFGGSYTCSMIACLQHTLRRGLMPGTGTHGMVSSMITVFMSLGGLTGPALGGMLMDTVGYSWGTMVLLGFQATVTALLTAAYVRESCVRRSTIHFKAENSIDVKTSGEYRTPMDDTCVPKEATAEGRGFLNYYGSCDAE